MIPTRLPRSPAQIVVSVSQPAVLRMCVCRKGVEVSKKVLESDKSVVRRDGDSGWGVGPRQTDRWQLTNVFRLAEGPIKR